MLPFSFYTCHRLVANSSHLHLAFLVTASVSPEYLLEIQILKLSPKVKESETLEMELCTFTSFLGDCRICVKLENRRSGSWMGRKSTDNNHLGLWSQLHLQPDLSLHYTISESKLSFCLSQLELCLSHLKPRLLTNQRSEGAVYGRGES